MSALEVIQANLIDEAKVLVTNTTGGTSVGDSSAGTSSSTSSDGVVDSPITTVEKAGAGILTFGMVTALLGGTWLMISEVGG